jgi:hydrophobe/amphiphile efflux-3 (HAE3) family protein
VLLRRPRLALLLLSILSLLMGYAGWRFSSFDTAADTIVDPGSQAFRHEVEYENTFGADPIVVLVQGDVQKILGGQGLQQLIRIESNMSNPDNTRRGVQSLYGPTSIATVSAVAAEGSLLARVQKAEQDAQKQAFDAAKAAGATDADANTAAQKAASDAGSAALNNAAKDFPEIAQIGLPSADNPRWTSAIFLDANGKPKPRFNAVVPDPTHILITGRLSPDSSQRAIDAIVGSIRSDVASNPIPGATVTVTGVPVLEAAVAHALQLALFVGMAVGALAMAILLLVTLRRQVRPAARLLPLLAGLFSVLMLGGLVSLIGLLVANIRSRIGLDAATQQSILASFTLALNPATLAAFPVALGLAVDYSVQFLYRHYQAQAAGDPGPLLASRVGAGRATLRAAVCTVAGLLALGTSGIPMVRQFGVAMILGVIVAWLVSRLTVLSGLAIMTRRTRIRAAVNAARRGLKEDEEMGLFGLSAAAATPAVAGAPATGAAPWGVSTWVRAHTPHVLVPALALAVIGWAALPFVTYETNPERLVSPQLPAFQALDRVRQVTGSSGELDFVLTGPDVTSDAALKWSADLQAVAARDTSNQFKIAGSLAQLFGAINAGKPLTNDQTKAFLSVIPNYFTDALTSRDHKLARIAFGINLAPIQAQAQQVQQIRNDVDAPPGYAYYPAGFTYLTMTGLDALQSGQMLLNILGAALVFVALLAIYRHRRLALFAWVPTLFVAGWSTAILFALRAPLTPMTAVLGALVVAFGTEFAVLWLERYREAVSGGVAAGERAAEVATRTAGPGIIVSGSALTLGFLALTIGGLPGLRGLGFDLPMLRDFGLVAAMDMVLALMASLVVLPALVIRIGLPLAAPATPVAEETRPARSGAPA